jgi:endonuclease YncB( thermonuclease family)
MCEHAAMVLPLIPARLQRVRKCRRMCGIAFGFAVIAATPCGAACAPPELGEGHVAEIIDGRSFRLEDGREIRLAGIEPVGATKADRISTLSAAIADHDVSLRGADDAPDRYGRQAAYVYLSASNTPVQAQLVSAGAALVSPDLEDRDCAAALLAAESEARQQQRGTWAINSVIKNAESSDDILAGLGRFTVVEGKVLSVHQSGATTYLNFGRSWTRDFAVTISRRALPALAQAGLAPKSLENKRIRVRGWVDARQGSDQGPMQGPRIDVVRVGQIELLGGN